MTTKHDPIPPTKIIIEDSIQPADKPNQLVYNMPSLKILLEYSINALETKRKIRVIDVRVGCSGATVLYTLKEEK